MVYINVWIILSQHITDERLRAHSHSHSLIRVLIIIILITRLCVCACVCVFHYRHRGSEGEVCFGWVVVVVGWGRRRAVANLVFGLRFTRTSELDTFVCACVSVCVVCVSIRIRFFDWVQTFDHQFNYFIRAPDRQVIGGIRANTII